MTDQEIIQGLIDRDPDITKDFFFQRSHALIVSIIDKYYGGNADYDELVNDLYLHLMDRNARRLRTFEGRSGFFRWLQMVADHFFLDKIKREQLIEKDPDDRHLNKAKKTLIDTPDAEAEMDVVALVDQLDNEKYRLVLRKHVIEGMDYDKLEKLTGIPKSNLYNIKKRALDALKKMARIARAKGDVLCAVRCEEYILHCFGIHRTVPELRDLAIAKGWLTADGAYIDGLGNTAAEFGLCVKKMEEASLQDIVKAIDEGKKVMAAVDGGELIGDPVEERIEDVFVGQVVDHCVVVLSVSEKDGEVALFDPAFGPIPLTVSVSNFLDAWADSNYHCVLISRAAR